MAAFGEEQDAESQASLSVAWRGGPEPEVVGDGVVRAAELLKGAGGGAMKVWVVGEEHKRVREQRLQAIGGQRDLGGDGEGLAQVGATLRGGGFDGGGLSEPGDGVFGAGFGQRFFGQGPVGAGQEQEGVTLGDVGLIEGQLGERAGFVGPIALKGCASVGHVELTGAGLMGAGRCGEQSCERRCGTQASPAKGGHR